jgi:hypothetical protein
MIFDSSKGRKDLMNTLSGHRVINEQFLTNSSPELLFLIEIFLKNAKNSEKF